MAKTLICIRCGAELKRHEHPQPPNPPVCDRCARAESWQGGLAR